MKKTILVSLIALAILITPVFAHQLWEYASFQERADKAVELGLVNSQSEYDGNYETNTQLLSYYESSGDIAFGSAPFQPSRIKWYLGQQLSGSATGTDRILISGKTDVQGRTVTTADFGTNPYIFLHINSGSSNDELISCRGISPTSTALIDCTRGYSFSSPDEYNKDNMKNHGPGEPIIISNDYHWTRLNFVNIFADQTIYSEKTYATTTGSKMRMFLFDSDHYIWADATGIGFASSSAEYSWNADGTIFNPILPLALTSGELKLATSTYDFILRDNLLGIATSTIGSGTASGNVIDDQWNTRYNATTTKSSDFTFSDDLTISNDLTISGDIVNKIVPYYGDGSDGAVTVTAANFFPNSASSTLATLVATSSLTMTVADASQFATSTYVFIHSARGENAGNWEIKKVAGRNNDTDVVTLSSALSNAYKATSGANITQILNVPQYTSVVFTGSGDIDPRENWRYGDATLGGVVVFYASEGVAIANGATVSTVGMGYKGGIANNQGEGTSGAGAASAAANGNGGGAAGAGGLNIFAISGNKFSNGMALIFGGGGGAGTGSASSLGGDGGGIFFPITPSFVNFGILNVSGNVGGTGGAGNTGGGGGGGAGSVYLLAEQITASSTSNSIILQGGSGGADTGDNSGTGGGGGGQATTGSTAAAAFGGAGGYGYVIEGWIEKLLPMN